MHYPCKKTALALALASIAFAPGFAQSQGVTRLDTVEVSGYGRGELRQVESVNKAELDQLPPGSSPLQAISRFPSVNFQSSDAFGAYEWSTRITVRGFSQNQLGFTLDDVPLGDMSYGNFNGLHISRAISTENLQRAVLSPGTGELGVASSSNLGGTLQFYSGNPSEKFGARVDQSFGSYNSHRTFLRVDSGNFGAGKLYLSFADQSSDKWKGSGKQRQQQFNLKYVLKLGESRLSAFANTSRRREIDYQDLSLSMINTLGYKADNFYPDYQAAANAARTLCGASYVPQCDYAYYAGSGLRNDELYGATLDAKLSAAAALKTTVYHHKNRGAGLWYTPYVGSPSGSPISIRTTEYGINRNGILSALTYDLGPHEIRLGFWYEDNRFDQARRFYNVDPANVASPYDFPSNPFLTQWQYAFKTRTEQYFIEDNFQVSDRLNVSAGFKSLRSTINGRLVQGNPATYPAGDITARKSFLPQFGVKYALSNNDELFAGFAENMRVFQGSALGLAPYATTVAGFQAIRGQLRPETSRTLEAGWRFSGRDHDGVVSAYHVDFKDRLLAIQQGAGIVGNPSVLANVGRVRMDGVELALTYKLAPSWSWYNGMSLSKSTYRDNYTSNGTTYATGGKRIVDAPDTMFKSILSYASNGVFGNLGLDYMGKRYYTYLNDGSVGSRTLLNASVGYRAKVWGMIKEPSVELSLTNLMNRKYVSTIGSNGFINSDPTGEFQTLQAGAPREVFVTFSAKM